jgi:hypothetical protein
MEYTPPHRYSNLHCSDRIDQECRLFSLFDCRLGQDFVEVHDNQEKQAPKLYHQEISTHQTSRLTFHVDLWTIGQNWFQWFHDKYPTKKNINIHKKILTHRHYEQDSLSLPTWTRGPIIPPIAWSSGISRNSLARPPNTQRASKIHFFLKRTKKGGERRKRQRKGEGIYIENGHYRKTWSNVTNALLNHTAAWCLLGDHWT